MRIYRESVGLNKGTTTSKLRTRNYSLTNSMNENKVCEKHMEISNEKGHKNNG